MKHLSIYAGRSALKRIREEGFSPSLFKGMAGASGGPKWFVLYGLDRYLYGEFFQQSKQPLYNIGSSAGGWQMACFSQKDPVAAIDRLAHYYSRERYSDKPTVDEISDKAEILLDKVLLDDAATEIAENKRIQTHWIVARAKGLAASENSKIQLMGLLKAATLNAISRSTLGHSFERYIFYSANSKTKAQPHYRYGNNTQYRKLTTDNVKQSLMATGAIPMVLRGIKNIKGSEAGIYRDGGIIDYHLDIDFRGSDPNNKDLVLYPHFFPSVKPGWFDKSLSWRKANPKNFDYVVMLTPSKAHIAELPYGKISDRKDFNTMDFDTRFGYWQTVLDSSHKLADDLRQLVEKGKGLTAVEPIEKIL